MPIQGTPLNSSPDQFPPAMQAVLARLTAADLLMSATTTTVYEVTAIIRDLITVCGEELTFKAIAQHVNDVFSTESGTSYTTAYYNGSYNSELIRDTPNGQVLSQGQEVALCMFVRANLSVGSITKVITYGQLVVYLHTRITYELAKNNSTGKNNTATAAVENALGVDLLNSRRYQYDLSTLVNSNGAISPSITQIMGSASDLLTVVGIDHYVDGVAAFTYTASGVATSVTKIDAQLAYRLWLLSRAAHPTHTIHNAQNLTSSSYADLSGSDDNVVQGSYDSAFYKGFKFSSTAATTALFLYSDLINYILTVSASAVAFYYKNTTTIPIYLNDATISLAGRINGDGLFNPDAVRALTATVLNQNGASLQNMHDIGILLNDVIALNRPTAIRITVQQAAGYPEWKKQIGISNFSFAEKTQGTAVENGSNFEYFSITGESNKDRSLLSNLIELYTETELTSPSNTFVLAVKAQYNSVTGSLQGPLNLRAVALAVTSWLFHNIETYTVNRTARKIMSVLGFSTSVSYFESLLSTPSIVSYRLTLLEVYDLTSIASIDTAGLTPTKGFSAFELKTYFGITAGAARDNGWSPALISATFTPSEIFSPSAKRQTIGNTTSYGLSVIEALLGYNATKNFPFFTSAVSAVSRAGVQTIGNTTVSLEDVTYRYNYDAIPFDTLAKLLSKSQIVLALKEALTFAASPAYTTSIQFKAANSQFFPQLTLTTTNISAFLDALQLPFEIATSLIGSQYTATATTKILEVDVANTTIYSKEDRRSLFRDLSAAATAYAKSGYSAASFIALGYPVSAWVAYAAPQNVNNRSISVSLSELMSATEFVVDWDDDFYVTTSTERALYNTVESRKALIKAFIPDMTDAEAAIRARGPVSDLPHAVV